MNAPTPQASAPSGPLNMDQAVQALAAILPEEGQQDGGETQESQPQDEEVAAAAEQETQDVQDESGDENSAEQTELEEDTQDETKPEVFTVKVDGKEVEVTLDELQKGYSRTQDYTRKTQQLAEARKAAEAELQAIRAEREQYAQLLGALSEQVKTAAEPKIDWDRLYKEDPIEYVRQREVMRENREKAAAIQAEQQRLAEIAQKEQMAQFESLKAKESEALLEALPAWKDPAKAKAEKAMLVEFGQKMGFTPQELGNIFDHRVVLALRKAALYDQMQAKRQGIKPVVNNGPRPAKPGAAGRVSQMSETARATQRLAKTGRVDDAASAIELLLR
jgi:chromosome segregation ATPase